MSEKLCGTCKFYSGLWRWNPYDEDDTELHDFGSCRKIKWQGFPQKHSGETTTEGLAFVRDHEEYNAGFYCKSDFGCILHEPKQSEDRPADG